MHRAAGDELVQNRRVLVVHHNVLLREGLCSILSAGGFSVVAQAVDGATAVDQLQESSANMVLLEWEAPAVDTALIEQLASQSAEIIIIVMSRPDTADDLSPALEAGAAGCLSVNLSTPDFLAALGMLAQGNMLVSHEMVAAVANISGDRGRPEDRLTARELEVLRALGRGATNQEIADELFISPHTVKIHVRRIFAKMGLRNRQQAAAYAASEGLV